MWHYMPAANATLYPHSSHIKTLCKIAPAPAHSDVAKYLPHLKNSNLKTTPVAIQVVNAMFADPAPPHAKT
jgi:hypothetical protein